ncbi:FimV/HubP family polar landmark protein [Motiliproteus sp. MSK22-1]|uniref:FimV/HubP family polar landmark protein n=1 Tax=Motiliproteus sp. MSK22-1 TaxID=1897630 RepID=UPI00097786EF|nr:FimV/HubP family polar landmark protein [Motiliproteus sp. MSK22-1]OMH38703.1 hypothetical protein BGP75_05795 [Motiliproteus sp. MSK22-1]
MLRKSAVTLAAIGALTTAQAQALGLGEVTVHSALNQPLDAEINLLQVRDLIQTQVIAGLADADDFYLAGVKPTTILSDINFQLDIKNGKGVIRLTTRDPIKEPFLNFLVEVNWPSGRLVREYTVLLDPPVFTAKDLAPRATPSAPVGTSVSSQTVAPTIRPSGRASNPGAVSSTANQQAGTGRGASYKVGARDNLWNIALKTRPDRSVSPQQMMLAIQKMNPDAFINNNINRLRSGVVLDIPNKQQIAALDFSTSVKEVKRQNSAWKETVPKNNANTDKKAEQLDASKSDSPQQTSASVDEQSQLRIVSKTPENDTGSGDAENISVDSEGNATGGGVAEELRAKNQELEEQLVVTLEGLDKVERDNTELFQRMERLAEQLESVQRLLLLKDQEMADLQNKLTEAQAGTTPVTPPPQPPTGGFLDKLLQSPAMLGGGVAGLLALLAGIWFVTRKRKSDEQEDEKAVEEAMAVLEEREKAAEDVDSTVESIAPEEPVVEEPANEKLAEVDVVDDQDDPFNLATDDDMSDEFEALISDDLDQELGDDLDMDLKIDEPVEEDSEMAEFTASLLNDEEYDLAGEDEENLASDDELKEAFDEIDTADETTLEEAADEYVEDEAAVDSVDNELDFILAEETADIEEEVAGAEADPEDELSELDMILEESEAESGNELSIDTEEDEEPDALSLDDADDLEIDGLDAILSEDSEDSLTEDSGLEELMDDADLAEASGLDTIDALPEEEEEDLLGDDALDDLLSQAEAQGMSPVDSEPVSEVAEDSELDLESFDLDEEDELADEKTEVSSEGLDLGEIDALDDDLDDLELEIPGLAEGLSLDEESADSAPATEVDLDEVVSEAEDEVELAEEASDDVGLSLESSEDVSSEDVDRNVLEEAEETPSDESSLMSLDSDEDLDGVNDEELEAELNLMLEGDDNELDLEETDVSDSSEELNYLDASDELGTKLDLARAYIDMDDPDGAKDILQEVIKDGDGPQQAEAKKLLDELTSQ